MNGAENIAIDCESACLSCCEDYSVCIPGREGHSTLEVVCYRKAVGLSLVEVAHQEMNHLPFLYAHDGPRMSGGTVAYAIIEA